MSILRPFLSRVIRHGRLTVLDPAGGAEHFGEPAPGFPEVSVRFASAAATFRCSSPDSWHAPLRNMAARCRGWTARWSGI